MQRPRALKPGDTVAAVSLSWGGPATFPGRYEAGKRQFEKEFGISVVEMPHALKDAAWLAQNPAARADDLMRAFADPGISGIIGTIGGDDSIRLLPHIDLKVIKENPKPFIGYSDCTVTNFLCLAAGLTSFYGPTIMAGFAENTGMHQYLVDSFRKILCDPRPPGIVLPCAEGWTDEFLDWGNPANRSRKRVLTPPSGWQWLQGKGIHEGRLVGGCFEILDWMRGSPIWPKPEIWDGAILFFETSEEKPSALAVKRFVRNLGVMGIPQRLAGVLFGRPGGQVDPSKFAEYESAILDVISGELGLTELPVVTQMDFGHTDPIMTLPLGVRARLDCDSKTFSIIEGAVLPRD